MRRRRPGRLSTPCSPRRARFPRQSPEGGRWLGRARGCARQSPGGSPPGHGHDSAYQSQGERSATTGRTRLRDSTLDIRAFFVAYKVLLLEPGDAFFQKSAASPIGPTHGSQPGAEAGRQALEGRELVLTSVPTDRAADGGALTARELWLGEVSFLPFPCAYAVVRRRASVAVHSLVHFARVPASPERLRPCHL